MSRSRTTLPNPVRPPLRTPVQATNTGQLAVRAPGRPRKAAVSWQLSFLRFGHRRLAEINLAGGDSAARSARSEDREEEGRRGGLVGINAAGLSTRGSLIIRGDVSGETTPLLLLSLLLLLLLPRNDDKPRPSETNCRDYQASSRTIKSETSMEPRVRACVCVCSCTARAHTSARVRYTLFGGRAISSSFRVFAAVATAVRKAVPRFPRELSPISP